MYVFIIIKLASSEFRDSKNSNEIGYEFSYARLPRWIFESWGGERQADRQTNTASLQYVSFQILKYISVIDLGWLLFDREFPPNTFDPILLTVSNTTWKSKSCPINGGNSAQRFDCIEQWRRIQSNTTTTNNSKHRQERGNEKILSIAHKKDISSLLASRQNIHYRY